MLVDGSWTVPGLWRPDEVRDRLGAPLPDGPAYETSGGYVMAELGRVPVVGDTVSMPGWEVSVVAMDGMRVDRLRFTPVGEPDASAGAGSEAGRASDAGGRSEGGTR